MVSLDTVAVALIAAAAVLAIPLEVVELPLGVDEVALSALKLKFDVWADVDVPVVVPLLNVLD